MITKHLLRTFLEKHPVDAARSLERLTDDSAAALLDELPTDVVAPVFGRMDPLHSLAILKRWPPSSQGRMLERLEPHKAAALLRRKPEDERMPLLVEMTSDHRRPLELLIAYPEHTVGAGMDPCYPCLPADVSLSEALKRVQASSDRTSVWWFTVDREQTLVGVVNLRALLSPNPGQKVSEVSEPCLTRLSALTDVASLRSSTELRRLTALPVVDEKNIYLGAIRVESVAAQEAFDEMRESLRVGGSALGELYRLGLSGLVHSLELGTEHVPANPGART